MQTAALGLIRSTDRSADDGHEPHCVQLNATSVVDVGAVPHCQRLTEGASDLERDVRVLAAATLQFGRMRCSAAGKLTRVVFDRNRCEFARFARPIIKSLPHKVGIWPESWFEVNK
jgi:hypothetical protein